MNKVRLIRHYEWQIRRLNRKINKNKSAKYLFNLIGNPLGLTEPAKLPVEYFIGEKRLAFAHKDNTATADLGIVIFWANARNGFIQKLSVLRGTPVEEEGSLQSIC